MVAPTTTCAMRRTNGNQKRSADAATAQRIKRRPYRRTLPADISVVLIANLPSTMIAMQRVAFPIPLSNIAYPASLLANVATIVERNVPVTVTTSPAAPATTATIPPTFFTSASSAIAKLDRDSLVGNRPYNSTKCAPSCWCQGEQSIRKLHRSVAKRAVQSVRAMCIETASSTWRKQHRKHFLSLAFGDYLLPNRRREPERRSMAIKAFVAAVSLNSVDCRISGTRNETWTPGAPVRNSSTMRMTSVFSARPRRQRCWRVSNGSWTG